MEGKFFDLLATDDDLTLDTGREPQLCTDRDVIAQNIIHMIREEGYLPPLVANRNVDLREKTKVEITLAVDNMITIVPGSALIEEPEPGTFYLIADTIDFGPLYLELR
ncbi:MAG: DUF2590 family protein [Desulfotalea sp.]